MPTTVLIEPDVGGHHLQAVANVARVALREGDVVLLTIEGVRERREFDVFLRDLEIEVQEVFTEQFPPTREFVHQLAAVCDDRDVATAVVMDGDQSLKRWWYLAPARFRLGPRPRIVFFLTRYPARLRLTDRTGWRLRGPKGLLTLVAMLTCTLHRAAGFAGRDEQHAGWVVKRVRDPEVCSSHSRDRAQIRAEVGLPADRWLVGVFGDINERRNVPLVWESLAATGLEADLVLGGRQSEGVRAWVAALPDDPRRRVISFDGFLSDELLDQLVASCNVAPIPLTNNGPSGIMGKAIAAGIPVVTAGSRVRARELLASGMGEVAELDAESLGAALVRVAERDTGRPWVSRIPPATPDEFGEGVLGVSRGRTRGQSRT